LSEKVKGNLLISLQKPKLGIKSFCEGALKKDLFGIQSKLVHQKLYTIN